MEQVEMTMSMAEVVARARHGVRTNPHGLPLSYLREQARRHGLSQGDVIKRVLGKERCAIDSRHTGEWVVKGRRWIQ